MPENATTLRHVTDAQRATAAAGSARLLAAERIRRHRREQCR
jgi:hypothetical protein